MSYRTVVRNKLQETRVHATFASHFTFNSGSLVQCRPPWRSGVRHYLIVVVEAETSSW